MMINPITNLPAPPPVPLELLFPAESQGWRLIDAEAPSCVGDPSCPVCMAALRFRRHHGRVFRAECSRSMAVTHKEPTTPRGGRYCRWTGWVTENEALKVWLVVGHGPTAPDDGVFDEAALWVPPPSLP